MDNESVKSDLSYKLFSAIALRMSINYFVDMLDKLANVDCSFMTTVMIDTDYARVD